METALSSLATDEGLLWQVLNIVCPVHPARTSDTSTCRIFLASQLICLIFLVTESCFQLFVLLFNIPSYFFSFAHFMLATHTRMFFFSPRVDRTWHHVYSQAVFKNIHEGDRATEFMLLLSGWHSVQARTAAQAIMPQCSTRRWKSQGLFKMWRSWSLPFGKLFLRG